MRVGFYHVSEKVTPHVELAARLIASVRRTMPGVPVVHLTDDVTLAIQGVDETQRRPYTDGLVALGCLLAYAAVGYGDWLFVDTDVIVQRDVRHVFTDGEFNVAVADRAGTLTPQDEGWKSLAAQPFNKGVVFSRCPAFWRDAADTCRLLKPGRQAWMGDQDAMNRVIEAGKYHVAVLPNSYNYPPKAQDDDVRDKHVLHYKGRLRKAWMLERAA